MKNISFKKNLISRSGPDWPGQNDRKTRLVQTMAILGLNDSAPRAVQYLL